MVDWNLRGHLIKTYVDLDDYQDWRGENAAVLRVANHLVERGEILDYPAHQTLTEGFPATLIGHNPSLPEARTAASWDDLRQAYRDHRVYLHTAKVGLEDGFNFAMLEAMATGMPVVATAHPSSPIQDGVNGFISADLGLLRERIKLLLDNPELAREMGKMARRTVKTLFPKQRYIMAWQSLLPQ
nr:glycosyltransferase [Acanthopleuribacter pedis]